jgi:ATP-dependent Lhr-like helicase
VLSLTTAHSFELVEVAQYLRSDSVRSLLVQALLDAPMFTTRWRWVAGVALALPRFRGGKKLAPQLARMEAEDLIASVFPDQMACAENVAGDREIPDHPLTSQAIADCLHDAMDVEGLERLLAGFESGAICVIARDLTQPSPLAMEVLSARPYAYLDDAPLEERRTQAVMARRWTTPESAADLGRLDPEAIARVRTEAWPDPVDAEELHDALLWLGCLNEEEVSAVPEWRGWLAALSKDNRISQVQTPQRTLWVAAERALQFQNLPDDSEALIEIVRGRLEGVGPVTQAALAAPLGLEPGEIDAALVALEVQGFALRGRFTSASNAEEWCDRRLLARIHHYTVRRLRAEIEPVAARYFLRFLFDWHRVTPETRLEGPDAIAAAVGLLEG